MKAAKIQKRTVSEDFTKFQCIKLKETERIQLVITDSTEDNKTWIDNVFPSDLHHQVASVAGVLVDMYHSTPERKKLAEKFGHISGVDVDGVVMMNIYPAEDQWDADFDRQMESFKLLYSNFIDKFLLCHDVEMKSDHGFESDDIVDPTEYSAVQPNTVAYDAHWMANDESVWHEKVFESFDEILHEISERPCLQSDDTPLMPRGTALPLPVIRIYAYA